MAGRFPAPIPESLEKGEWTRRLGTGIKRWMLSVEAGLGGLQGTPVLPSQIQAGVAASRGTSQAAAASDIVHDIETATPNRVALGGTPDEGTGSALMRADAVLVLEEGVDDGDLMVWDEDTATWVSMDGVSAIEDAVDAILETELAASAVQIMASLDRLIMIVKIGLNVDDDPDTIRSTYGHDSLMLRELDTLAYFLSRGLNVDI